MTHRDRVIKELRTIVRLYELAIFALERSKNFSDAFFHNKHTLGAEMVKFFIY